MYATSSSSFSREPALMQSRTALYWKLRMIHDGQIVGCKIPNYVYIVLKQAQINSHRIIVKELSKRPFIHHLPYSPDRAGKQERVIDHYLEVLSARPIQPTAQLVPTLR